MLLNDVQFVEACRKLAERVLQSNSDDDARVSAAFLALTGRMPDATESETLLTLLADEKAYFAEHTESSAKLLALGETKSDTKTDPPALAAMTTVCQAILNLDATVWKR